jgi:hypothetical protein
MSHPNAEITNDCQVPDDNDSKKVQVEHRNYVGLSIYLDASGKEKANPQCPQSMAVFIVFLPMNGRRWRWRWLALDLLSSVVV